jgi:2-keto-4-pentenoate hydratase/2-oxohepta-3-ene-1,7-dioic acid hydratase in catechol pathway
MKFCNFTVQNEVRLGLCLDDKIADLTKAGIAATINELIENPVPVIDPSGLPFISYNDVRYANVTVPSKIVCIGLNYKKHAEETGGTAPKEPVVFSKFNDTLSPAGSEVFLPEWQRCYDYEAELVIIIGKEAWNVTPDEAKSHIFGYTCGNDLSARDCQFISNQWLIGKTFPGFAPAGPFIVTADSFDPDQSHRIVCERNGIVVQDGNTNDMIFNCSDIVSYVSRYCRLLPGDLIFTGTPSGVIMGKAKGTRDWLKKGETLRVTIDGIGTLENKLV